MAMTPNKFNIRSCEAEPDEIWVGETHFCISGKSDNGWFSFLLSTALVGHMDELLDELKRYLHSEEFRVQTLALEKEAEDG